MTSPGEVVSVFTSPYLSAGAPALGEAKGLMSIFTVINQYLYGFIYIECFYKMNIYKSLYNAIIDPNKTYFPHHRLFDPLFSYLGVIFLSLLIPKQKEKENIEKTNEEENIARSTAYTVSHELNLIHNGLKNYII